jgi:hypothetical protein
MNIDELLRKSLSESMIRISDPQFTKTIVDRGLEKDAITKPVPFTGFASLMVGMILMITSSGILLLDFFNMLPSEFGGFNPDTGVILVALATTFLLYTLLTELSIKRTRAS